MSRIISFAITFCYFSLILAQNSYEFDPASDVYGIELVFKEKILTGKYDCCCGFYPKSKKCTLYKVEINEVFLHRDSSVFRDAKEIQLIEYMILPSNINDGDVLFDTNYTIFGYNSCSDKLLVINQLLNSRPDPTSNYNGFAFLTGLVICKRFTFFQKIFLALGINRERIYSKAKDLPPESSKFIQAIKEKEKK